MNIKSNLQSGERSDRDDSENSNIEKGKATEDQEYAPQNMESSSQKDQRMNGQQVQKKKVQIIEMESEFDNNSHWRKSE